MQLLFHETKIMKTFSQYFKEDSDLIPYKDYRTEPDYQKLKNKELKKANFTLDWGEKYKKKASELDKKIKEDKADPYPFHTALKKSQPLKPQKLVAANDLRLKESTEDILGRVIRKLVK